MKKREGTGEKCEKSEKREKMEKRERGRRKEEEKERRKGWAAGLLHDTANVVGIMPAMSRPPLHKKRPWFEPHRKNTKKCGTKQEKCKFEQSEHWFVTTNRPKWHLHRPRRPQMLITVVKNEQKCHKTPSPLSEAQRKCHEPQQKRQIDVQKTPTCNKNMAKTTI